ncbi:MAG: DUF4468 domain-containing protein [Bacteroidota bacterium]|nr:DUF4468 domain-containing protein [Bacteroidota bacterium]
MKTVLIAVYMLFISVQSSAQRQFIMWPTDSNKERIVFNESVYVIEAGGNTLFDNAKMFASNNFNVPKDTVIFNDAAKTVICKGAFFININELGQRGQGYISFTLTIWCHKNNYSYMLSDLQHLGLNAECVSGGPLENDKAAAGGMAFPLRYWNEQKAKCYYRVQSTIEKLKLAMTIGIGS